LLLFAQFYSENQIGVMIKIILGSAFYFGFFALIARVNLIFAIVYLVYPLGALFCWSLCVYLCARVCMGHVSMSEGVRTSDQR
jgi:hypothetical protein